MKTVLVNEDVNHENTDWSVSMDGHNTRNNSQTVLCANKDEAFKLKKIIDDLKEKISWLCDTMEPMLDEGYENNAKLHGILEDIRVIYL